MQFLCDYFGSGWQENKQSASANRQISFHHLTPFTQSVRKAGPRYLWVHVYMCLLNYVCMLVYVHVCVCERERDRET